MTSSTDTAATGRTRDPFVDVLRAGAIVVVVCGHWLTPVLHRHGDMVVAGNALATPGWWLLTGPLQVMPVFFFASGAANLYSYRADGDARRWLSRRLARLTWPVLPLLATWLVLPNVLVGFGIPEQPVALAASTVGQALWFLAVYVVAVAVVPLAHVANRRWGLAVPVVLAIAALGVPFVGHVHDVLVWLALSQLGLVYADGALGRITRPHAVAMACGGFGSTALVVLFGHYSASMLVGQQTTTCLLLAGVGQIGVLLALRDRIAKVRLPRSVATRGMTIYLWHLPALVVVAGIAVLGFGYATPPPGSLLWLAVLPAWLASAVFVMALLVRVFGRFETWRPAHQTPGTARLCAAVVLSCLGFAGLSLVGFQPVIVAALCSASVFAGVLLALPGLAIGWLAGLLDSIFG